MGTTTVFGPNGEVISQDTEPDTPEQIASAAQTAALNGFLETAQSFVDLLRAVDDAYVAALDALTAALEVPAPTPANTRAMVLAVGSYLTVDQQSARAIGAELIEAIKALASAIAIDVGSTTVVS